MCVGATKASTSGSGPRPRGISLGDFVMTVRGRGDGRRRRACSSLRRGSRQRRDQPTEDRHSPQKVASSIPRMYPCLIAFVAPGFRTRSSPGTTPRSPGGAARGRPSGRASVAPTRGRPQNLLRKDAASRRGGGKSAKEGES